MALVRPHHPFLNPAQLEDESNKLLEECITALYTSRVPSLISSITSASVNLVKARPALSNLILTALTNWSPAALADQSNLQVRSVEKLIRASLTHLVKWVARTLLRINRPNADSLSANRSGHGNAFSTQINDFLASQSARMEQAIFDARQQKDQEASRKRQTMSDQIASSAKRRRLDSTPGSDAQIFSAPDNPLSTFDATTLPLPVVIDVLVATFQTINDTSLSSAIEVRKTFPKGRDAGLTSTRAGRSVTVVYHRAKGRMAASLSPPRSSLLHLAPTSLHRRRRRFLSRPSPLIPSSLIWEQKNSK